MVEQVRSFFFGDKFGPIFKRIVEAWKLKVETHQSRCLHLRRSKSNGGKLWEWGELKPNTQICLISFPAIFCVLFINFIMKTLFFIQKQTFRLFSSSTSLGLGFLDSSENPLPPTPPPPCLEVISTQVLLLILILFYLFILLFDWEFFFLGVNSIDFFVCEIHCGASELGGTYFAQGNFFPFLCLFTEKMSCLCGFCLCAFDFWPRIKMLNLFMYLKNQFLK